MEATIDGQEDVYLPAYELKDGTLERLSRCWINKIIKSKNRSYK